MHGGIISQLILEASFRLGSLQLPSTGRGERLGRGFGPGMGRGSRRDVHKERF